MQYFIFIRSITMSLIIAMSIFSLSMSISPGPVNFIALASGVNYGFWRSFPFVSGATIGFILLLFLIGIGMGSLSSGYSQLLGYLSYVGCTFIFYMGVKVFSMDAAPIQGSKRKKIPSFIQGFSMQWLNPKAWMACLAGSSAFNVYESKETLLLFISVYFAICYLGISCWSLLGDKMSIWLNTQHRISIFNKFMGVALCMVAIYLLFF